MKNLFLVFLFSSPIFLSAQIYIDASENLPNFGAKGPSMDVQAADIDNDGDLDIVLANEFQANTILINDGSGVFTNGTNGNLPQPIHDSEDVVVADFSGDGILDLVFCSEDDFVLNIEDVHEYYLGNGDGSFSSADFKFTDSEANAVITVDLNNDDSPDLLFGNNGGTGVFINNGDGTFSEEDNRVPQVNKTTQDLAVADVDGDGDMDLFEGNENGNILHINDGTGNFTNETNDRLPSGLNLETRKVTFGDVDGDDDLDIFLSNVEFIPGKNRQNRLFINDGNGFFSDETIALLPTDNDHTIDAIFEDVDLDEDLDLIVANVFGGPIKIYENDGAGNFSIATSSFLEDNYFMDALGVIAADFNGDGFRDIYICDRFQQANNGKDRLLLREGPSNSVDQISEDVFMTIYPNPVSNTFRVNTNMEMSEEVMLSDTSGKVVGYLIPQKDGIDTYLFDLTSFSIFNGIYILKVGEWERQIIVEKN